MHYYFIINTIMLSNFQKIKEFHTAFGLPCCDTISIKNLQDFKIASLRIKLIQEESIELYVASDIVEQLDAIGDLLYVVYGAGASFGFDLDKLFHEFCMKQFVDNFDNFNEKSLFDKTNFQKSVIICSILYPNKSQHDPTYIRSDKKYNIETQLHNLSHALLMCDTTAVQTILVQMLYTLYCVGYFCGFDLDKLFDSIHKSNMSKLCDSENEAIETVQWYIKNQLERYPSPSYKYVSGSNKWIVFDKTTDKRLKSIRYLPPVISPNELALYK